MKYYYIHLALQYIIKNKPNGVSTMTHKTTIFNRGNRHDDRGNNTI